MKRSKVGRGKMEVRALMSDRVDEHVVEATGAWDDVRTKPPRSRYSVQEDGRKKEENRKRRDEWKTRLLDAVKLQDCYVMHVDIVQILG
uniref:Uncharacterized protein n=1 Tax=Oryza punctata TaxID=4537 RepID=A0A0E0JJ56_ORYPU